MNLSISNAIGTQNLGQETKSKTSLLDRYLAYADKQDKVKMIWYMKVILAYTNVYMVISIFAMAMLTPHYVWFVGLTVLLFYSNVILHIAGVKSRVYVPWYQFTSNLLFVIPIITYLIG